MWSLSVPLGANEWLFILCNLLYDFSDFRIRNLHIILFSNCEFHENLGRKGCTFLMEVYEILLIFVCFSLNLDNIQYRIYAEKVGKNQCSESHTWPTSIKNLHLYFPHLFLDLGEIQCKRFAHIVSEFCLNWCGESYSFLLGVNETTYIFSYIVKPHHFLKI
jgi:hypothetical protein